MPGFFSSLLSAAPAAANASAAFSEGQREGVDRNVAQALQAITLKRQAQQDEISRRLSDDTHAHIVAQTEALGNDMYEKAEPFTLPSGEVIMAQRNKKTRGYEPVYLNTPKDTPSADVDSHASVPVASTPDESPVVDGPPTVEQQQAATPPQAAQPSVRPLPTAGKGPAKSPLMPYVKPSATANDRSPVNFTLNGKPVAGTIDKQGRRYDAAGVAVPATAVVAPFTAPRAPVEPTIVQGVDSTGKPIAYRIPRGGGDATPVGGFQGKPTSTAQSARGLAAMLTAGSGLGSIREMAPILDEMKQTEALIDSGKVSLNGWDSFRQGLIEHAQGHKGFVDQGITTALLGNLAKTNPELVNYATNKIAFIMADLNLSKGGSDERGRLANLADGLSLPVSSMDPAARHKLIASMQNRRDARYQGLLQAADAVEVGLQRASGKGTPSSAGRSAPPTQQQKDYDAAAAHLKAQGKDPLKEIGPRP